MLTLDRLELDGNLLAGLDVRAEVDVTEGAAAYLAPQPVLVRDANLHGCHGPQACAEREVAQSQSFTREDNGKTAVD